MTGRLRFAVDASYAVAVLFVIISLGGLLIPSLYAREMPDWKTQAIAQDWFDLVVASPVLAVAARWASRSPRGRLVLAGALLFVIYTLLIYAFAIHLNALFLVYCGALGLALFALIALPVDTPHLGRRRWPAAYLVAIGIVFALLWLGQLVPAAITGRAPAALESTGLATNPVHVIDLAFILPLHVIAGVALWRGQPLGGKLAPIVLVFGALMSASIAFLMVAQRQPMAIAMGAVAAISLGMAGRLLRVSASCWTVPASRSASCS